MLLRVLVCVLRLLLWRHAMLDVWGHRLARRLVDVRLWHVGESVGLRRSLGADWLRHTRSSSVVVSGRRSGAHLRLGSVASGRERDTVDGRRRRGRVASQVLRKLRMLARVLRRHHVRLYRALVTVGRGAFAIIVLVVVGAAIEVGGALVLVRTAVLQETCVLASDHGSGFIKRSGMAVRTYWYFVISSRMSAEEYSYSFLLLPKMKTATSTEQSTESSCAFLNRPPFRFRKVLAVES